MRSGIVRCVHADRDGSTPDDAVEPSFEQILARLHQVVERLESGELPLEESLTAFEEGVRLSRLGASRLDAAERRVEELLGDSGATRPLPENAAFAARAADPPKSAPSARDRSNRDE